MNFDSMTQALEQHSAENEAAKELLHDPSVRSIYFRRHSEWGGKRGEITQGALTSEGIKEAKERAKDEAARVESLKEELQEKGFDVDVAIYESSSTMPAQQEKEGGEVRRVMNRRTAQTASIYEKAIFGDLALSAEGKKGQESSRRKRAALLGDLMEGLASFPAEERKLRIGRIPGFFKAKAQAYGEDEDKFWDDYVSGNLDPRVEEARRACGAFSSQDLARNFEKFLETEQDGKEQRKEIEFAITHNETLRSFAYHLREFFIQNNESEKAEMLSRHATNDFDYNEGFNAHIASSGDVVLELNGKTVAYNPETFKEFLSQGE